MCVHSHSLTTTNSILISSNGIAAVKFIRSVRSWAYKTFGDERAIALVAMATPEDLKINAEHLRMADQFVEVPGGLNTNNFKNVPLITQVAENAGVDAVWPGWGNASEDPELPRALTAKGIAFIGPGPEAMAALGDKIGSTILAQAAQVPTIPWSGSHVSLAFDECDGVIPHDVYMEACVTTAEEALASCKRIGFPVMLKASEGGGGKGIRKVSSEDEVVSMFKQVQGEVPGSPIFTMKLASMSRHLEVQLICDMHGNVAALHGRDCSIQRRHQKIIEEGPITVASQETLRQMETAARSLAKAVGYVGAATVEYLYSEEEKKFYFLELNPRLQVEHPVTEWISGVNIPATMVMIAMGIPLWCNADIRRLFGCDMAGALDPIDFDTARSVPPRGHVIAVRITSENPDDGFKPTSGSIDELNFRSSTDVWGYFSVKSNGGIHEFSDSQFGHLFAKGENRDAAIHNMVLALKDLSIRGEILTIVDYCIDLIQCEEYVNGEFHTGWLDSRIARKVRAEQIPWHLAVLCGGVHAAEVKAAALVAEYIEFLKRGQIPPAKISAVEFDVELVLEGVKYALSISRYSPGGYSVVLGDTDVLVEVRKLRDGGLLVQIDGSSYAVYAEEEPAGTRLLVDGRTCIFTNEHDPSELRAQTPGKLMRRLVDDDAHISANEAFAEVEVMKMCMPLLAPASGVIHWRVGEGYVMSAGDMLAVMELDDITSVMRATLYTGDFPELGEPNVIEYTSDKRFEVALNNAKMILAGYKHDIEETTSNLLSFIDDPELPLHQWNAIIAAGSAKFPKSFLDRQSAILMQYEDVIVTDTSAEFPLRELLDEIDAVLDAMNSEVERVAMRPSFEPLYSFAEKHGEGREGFARCIANELFEEFLRVENPFGAGPVVEVVDSLRRSGKTGSLEDLVADVISHQGVERKVKFMHALFDNLVLPNPVPYTSILRRFSALSSASHSRIALIAIQMLEKTLLSELRASVARMLSGLNMFDQDIQLMSNTESKSAAALVLSPRRAGIKGRMEALIETPAAVEDALAVLLDHSDQTLQERALEAYCKRTYFPSMDVMSFFTERTDSGILFAAWSYDDSFGCSQVADDGMPQIGIGVMIVLRTIDEYAEALSHVAALRQKLDRYSDAPVTLHVALMSEAGDTQVKMRRLSSVDNMDLEHAMRGGVLPDQLEISLAEQLANFNDTLRGLDVRVVSMLCNRGNLVPDRIGFVWQPEAESFVADPILRHVEPPIARRLQLRRLSDMKPRYCASRNRQFHLYLVQQAERPPLRTIFGRAVVRRLDASSPQSPTMPMLELEDILKNIMLELERASYTEAAASSTNYNMSKTLARTSWAHIYLYVLPRILLLGNFTEDAVSRSLRAAAGEVADRLTEQARTAGVSAWETRFDFVGVGVFRITVNNPSGHSNTVDVYKEENGKYLPTSSTTVNGLSHKDILAPYTLLSQIDRRRLAARRHGTTYVYDWPTIMEAVLLARWEEHKDSLKGVRDLLRGEPALEAREFVMSESDPKVLEYVRRPAGENTVGMVAWEVNLRTPEAPCGRTVIVVANDVTYGAGAFSPKEGDMFRLAVETAIARKLPVVYIAANSGARIGLAEEVRAAFKVSWVNEKDPSQGVAYLYLEDTDYERLKSLGSIQAVPVEVAGQRRWRLTDVIGVEDGLGVECLSSSGSIAGIFSQAWAETFTLTFVSGRTVGIGAYLARLGHRVVQREDQPIILTGYAALNKLLGREVYTSHLQLGGPRVMGQNGVVHEVVCDDVLGMSSVLKWLSYVPESRGSPLPLLPSVDGVEREVEYVPAGICDARSAIAGTKTPQGDHLLGIFDEGSWMELQSGWARTVICGRARLGGIPLGVIAVETQTVMLNLPADPGMPDSEEQNIPQAGMVWYPDSAEKTAMAMEEMAREGLPLFILANWRGFSGGQRDLFEGVLQAGSQIVEQLRQYPHPCFVYVPRGGELRGGAWVVIDSQINPNTVEMYADSTARGGVLEPDGLIEIKFRDRELLATIHRLDEEVLRLDAEIRMASSQGLDTSTLKADLKRREKYLLPSYRQAALRFAELHDTPQRMLAKGVIRKIVRWEESRSFFYWRLRARLEHGSLVDMVQSLGICKSSRSDAAALIAGWIADIRSPFPDDGRAFVEWLVRHRRKLELRAKEYAADIAAQSLVDNSGSIRLAIERLMANIKDEDKKPVSALADEFIQALKHRDAPAEHPNERT